MNPLDEAPTGLTPDSEPDDDTGWQQRKSAIMRRKLLEATICCLAELGYAQTTTKLVARRAGVSRGAMLHHYASRDALIAAVIDYAFLRRLQMFRDAIAAVPAKLRIEEERVIDILWNLMDTTEFQAYLELSMAARTDDKLRSAFEDKMRSIDRNTIGELQAALPEWAERPMAQFVLAIDVVNATLEGMYLNSRRFSRPRKRQAVRAFLKEAVRTIRET